MPRAANAAATLRQTAAAAAKPAPSENIVAVLGPTNTGKTHYAIERMLGHRSGVIGFPLRLLAREVYDRVVAKVGPREVALITGEEKIMPPNARFVLCTVEAMPVDWGADFLAVDEIQLAADPERGHIFTERLLHARGRLETMFLGATTMWDRIAALAPGVRFVTRERLSTLSYAGSKKLSRLPARSAVVAFSVENVYAIAELIRRQRGGAAVVMGALSPRTRNAQVALFQQGDVDFLVATDAIGMGLNLDVGHVAFAGVTKFDGRRMRRLRSDELAQIAGRAGRHLTDGSFGVTGEAGPLEPDVVEAIEHHRFHAVGRLQWRSAALEFGSAPALIRSLEADPSSEHMMKAREADDLAALRRLAADPDIAARARGRSAVKRLWDVCRTPDFRKTLITEHVALLSEIYRHLTSDAGVAPEDWMAKAVARVDRTDGDIDALSKRLAYVRTWTYVANRADWLADPAHWRGVTREIEDKVSDALHARLTQRFVDRRTSVLARRLKQKERLVAEIEADGSVSVEGEFVGRLEGFRFQPDPSAGAAEAKTLQAASAQALAMELARRVEKFYAAPDGEIDVTEQGGMMWGDAAVGRLDRVAHPGADPLAIKAVAFADDLLEPAAREKIERRLQFWIDRKIAAAFEPLVKLRDDPEITGLARGVGFQLCERLGVIPRQEISNDVRALEQADRAALRKHGVRFGQHTVFMPALLKPAATRLRLMMWGLGAGLDILPPPPPAGAVTVMTDPEAEPGYYVNAGYRACGPRAVRVDILERLADLIRPLDARAGFEATPEMLSIAGATLDQFAEMMVGLGFEHERGERPKTAKAPAQSRKKRKDAKRPGENPLKAAAAAAAASGAVETAEPSQPPAPPASPSLVFYAAARDLDAPDDAALSAATDAAATMDEPGVEAAAVDASELEAAQKVEPEAAADAGADEATRDSGAEEAEEAAADAGVADAAQERAEAAEERAETDADVTTDASAAEAGDTPDAAPMEPEAEREASASDKPVEMEAFYIFRLAPRQNRRREGERGPRRRGDEAGAQEGGGRGRRSDGGERAGQGQGQGPRAGQSDRRPGGQRFGGARADGPRSDGPRSDGPRSDGPRTDGPRAEGARPDGQKPGGQRFGGQRYGGQNDGGGNRRREDGDGAKHGQRGPRPQGGEAGREQGRKREADPDSPFAVLQKLKDQL